MYIHVQLSLHMLLMSSDYNDDVTSAKYVCVVFLIINQFESNESITEAHLIVSSIYMKQLSSSLPSWSPSHFSHAPCSTSTHTHSFPFVRCERKS